MSIKSPLVSVIVPNYNHALYLRERVDSILKQSYQNFEIILLDDCSTDNSRDIIESYRNDTRISQIIYNKENSGSPFKQWRKGVETAKGEYIWIAESDDTALPNFLSTLVPQLDNNPKAVLVFSHSFLISSDGSKINKDFHHNSGNNIIIHNGNRFAKHIMTTHNYIYNASMVVFRRSAFLQVEGTTYQNYRSCGDWALWMSMCLQGQVIEVCQKLSCFRQHQNKVTVKASRTGNDWQEVSVILSSFITQLQLKGIALHLYRGKWTGDLCKSRVKDKTPFITKYPDVFGGSKIDVFLYKLYAYISS